MSKSDLHVVVDCRKAADLGIGRYIRGLLGALEEASDGVRYTLLVDAGSAGLLPRDERFAHHPTGVGHYRVHEPLVMGRIIDGIAPDVFHAPHYVFPISRVPGVVTIHDLIHLGLKGWRNAPRRTYARAMIGRAVRASREILTVSRATADRIEARWPASGGRVTVTPNGVDAEFFSITRRPDTTRPTLLYVGNDKPHKNLDRLVAAWGRAQRPESARLVIAGSRPERFAGMRGVELAGTVRETDLRDLYATALALVMPSLEEGFGLPAAEAMAAGVPVLASEIPALQEIGAGATLGFDPSDVESIASAIGRVFADGDLRDDLARRGGMVAAGFSWRLTAAATLAAYRRAAGRETVEKEGS